MAQLINSDIQQSPNLFKHILKSAEKVLDCKHVSIFLVDDISGRLKLTDSSSSDVKRKFFEPGQGLVSEVVKSGKSLLVSDIRKHSKFVKGLTSDREERSMLLSPIKLRERIIGVISADFHGLNGFDNHDQVLLEALTKQTATALQNTELYQKERDKAQALTNLYKISRKSLSIRTSSDIRKLLEKIADISKQVLKADVIELYEYSSTHKEFKLPQITAGNKYAPPISKKEIYEDDTVFKLINRTEPLFTEDVQKESVFSENYAVIREDQPKERFVIREDIRSNAVIPLKTGFESVGLMFANYRTPQKFTNEQRELIILFADQAAMVIKNAQMYHYVNQRRNTLIEIGKRITAGIQLSESDVLELIYEQASNVLEMKNISIALYDETTDTIRFVLASAEGIRRDVDNELRWEARIGKTETIIRTKKYLLLSTRREVEQAGFTPTPGQRDYEGKIASSWLGVPMMVGDRVLGVIANYDSGKDYFYNDDDIEILQALADIAAIAIDNSRLAHQLRLTNNRQTGLIRLSQNLTSSIQRTESEILQLIYDSASELMHTDNMYIALYDESSEIIRFLLVYEEGKKINAVKSDYWKSRNVHESGRTEWIILNKKFLLHKTKKEAENWYKELGRQKRSTTILDSSWMGVPMIIRDNVVGVIGIHHSTKEYVYNEDDVNIMLLMANQAAIAIENARLYEDIRKAHNELEIRVKERTAEINAAYEISEAAHTVQNLESLYSEIHKTINKLMPAKNFRIGLYNSDTDTFKVAYFRDEYDNLPDDDLMRKGLTGYVLRKKEALIISPKERDELIKKREVELLGEPSKSWAGVPLKVRDKYIGVMIVQSYQAEHTYGEKEKKVLMFVSDQIAMAIERVRTQETLEIRTKQLDAAYKISEAVHGVRNLQELYESVHRIIGKLMFAENFRIVTFNPGGKISKFLYFDEKDKDPNSQKHIIEKGMTGYVFKTGCPLLIIKPEDHIQLVKKNKIESVGTPSKSWLGVPLNIHDKAVGVLTLHNYDEEGVYGEAEKNILIFVSEQIAITIERIKTEEELRKSYDHLEERVKERTVELNAVYKISEAAHTVKKLKELYPLIHNIVSELMPAKNIYIALYDSAAKIIIFAYFFDEYDGKPDYRKNMNGVTEYILRTEKSLMGSSELFKQLRIEKGIEVVGRVPENFLGVPLKTQNKTTGVLAVQTYSKEIIYGESEKNVLIFVSEQIAMAIERVRAEEELEKYRDHLEEIVKERTERLKKLNHRQRVLIDLEQKLTSTIQLNENQILQLIYQDASELMDTDNMYIALYDESTDTVRFGLVYKEGRKINTKEGEEEEGYKPRSGGQGKTEYIIKARQPIFHPTLAESKAWYEESEHLAYDRSILPSWVGVPMIKGEKVLGVIATYNPIQEHVYSKDDLKILQAMANLAAITLDNARLYSEKVQQSKELEERKNLLEKANRNIAETQEVLTRSMIASDFVHQLNNLAGTIPVWTNFLKEKTEDLIHSIQRDVNKLLREGEKLKKPLQEEYIDMTSILQSLLNNVRFQYVEKIQAGQIEIKGNISPELYQVWGISSSLSDAIFNVILNGIESVLEKGSGTLTVRADNYTDEKQWIKIEITDTGKGISEENIGKIFEPFFTSKEEGRGYGLWRTKNIIEEKFKGKIRATSQYGKSVIFIILLPAIKED
ncbi:MAG: GAF domain-containing protein [Desulfobacterales bacterium]|nr:GAF domain-containing protein [Desulfobacterales bacterium]